MFTGIVGAIGTITETRTEGGGLAIAVSCPWGDATIGESIAINGCCLTAVTVPALTFHLSAETLASTAPRWKAGTSVNLERALQAADRLGGHLVTGHVDGTARITNISPAGESRVFALEAPESLKKFIAAKGSVTLDGVSLTVNEVKNSRFTVNVIPHTLSATTLGERKTGDALNLEIDLVARYLERLTAPR